MRGKAGEPVVSCPDLLGGSGDRDETSEHV